MSSTPLKIFLVEDHHIMRRGLASLLTTERDAHIVGEAASGEEAFERLQGGGETPDLILMDVSLPGASGIETTRRIKAAHRDARILVLSMYDNPTFVQQALQAGASGYLLKQSMVEELNSAIDAVLRGEQYISPIITRRLDPEAACEPRVFESFTHREVEVFERLARGMAVRAIAEDLVVSIYTVYTHLAAIKRKLGLEKTADLVRYALENPLVLRSPGRGKGEEGN